MKKFSPELFEEMLIALNRSTAFLMEFNNLMLKNNLNINGLHEFIESNLELLEKINLSEVQHV